MEEIRLMIDMALVILIWLVQLIIYPAFHSIEKKKFRKWHQAYTRSISVLVFPLMLCQLAIYLWELFVLHHGYFLISFFLVLGCWAQTFLLSSPIHFQLGVSTYNVTKVNRLIRFNWLRVFGWNLVWALSLYKSYFSQF